MAAAGDYLRHSVLFLLLLPAIVHAQQPVPGPEQRLHGLADRFVAQQLAADPTIAYQTGLAAPDDAPFPDHSPAAVARLAAEEQADLAELREIDTKQLPAAAQGTYASLREQLEAELQMRICKPELWNVNHFSGWPSNFADVAEQQPVATAEQRAAALRRWATLPAFIDTEIADLKLGLLFGYSAPQTVVRRVIAQIGSMSSGAPEVSPFDSPAARSPDAAFQKSFRTLIATEIDPALRRYRDYLQNNYLPHARTGVAISDLPDGAACYAAFLRANTTLSRTPSEVYALGEQTVAAYRAEILHIGHETYGTTTLESTLVAERADPANRLSGPEDLLASSRVVLAQARQQTAAMVIDRMPKQPIVIEALRPFEETGGASSRIETQGDETKPAIYRIRLSDWKTETRGEAALVVCHEAWPGHHLQIALSRELEPDTPLRKLVNNAAYAEGWARYAEGMAEEIGVLQSADARLQRRLWPAHGMVLDPGLHVLHWTREQAVNYLLGTGQYTPTTAEDMIDRVAVMPAQLTAYDSGALEIRALRKEAEEALGPRFNLRSFHHAVVAEGNIPLLELRREVRVWIAAQKQCSLECLGGGGMLR